MNYTTDLVDSIAQAMADYDNYEGWWEENFGTVLLPAETDMIVHWHCLARAALDALPILGYSIASPYRGEPPSFEVGSTSTYLEEGIRYIEDWPGSRPVAVLDILYHQ